MYDQKRISVTENHFQRSAWHQYEECEEEGKRDDALLQQRQTHKYFSVPKVTLKFRQCTCIVRLTEGKGNVIKYSRITVVLKLKQSFTGCDGFPHLG